MLATAQSGDDFRALNAAVKASIESVFSDLDIATQVIELPAATVAQYKAMPGDIIGVVESGMVSVLHNNTVVSVLDAGDLVMPDNDYLPASVTPLLYGAESGARIRTYSKDDLMAALRAEPERHNRWLQVVSQHLSLLLRLNALHIREAVGMGGTPEIYARGSVIIRQGDPADDIFSMAEGLAEVLVNDMPVAKIRPGELFGTMAALTGSHRNATVRAVESCSVIRVPKDRFFELIRSRPSAVQGLLVDMAKSITELNEEVVALRRRSSAN